MINAFGGTTQTNATSNVLRTTNTGNRNTTTVQGAANTASVDAPIQEEKTIENEQGDDNEEEEYYELATYVFPDLFSGTTTGNATPEQTASPNSSPSPTQVATPKNASPTATSPTRPNNSASPVQVATPKSASPMTTSPSRPNPSQPLTPVVSTKPGDATAENTVKQPSPSSSPKQPVTPVISTRPIVADGENTANTLSMQQSPKQSSPTQETQIALVGKPENAGTNKSESSGTTESEKGAMTRLRAVTKGKELKAVNEAKDPEAKAKLLRAIARQKKEREQKATTDASKQDKDKVKQNNSPQPKPSNTDPQVRSPVVTFKTDASITTPMRSPSTKTSSSTPSDLTRSDSSEQKAQTSADPHKEPKDISELLPVQTKQDLEDVNDLLGNFLGRANKTRKKEPTKSREDSMEEHVSSVDKKRKEHTKMHSSPTKDNMKEPFGEVVKPPRTIDRISPNSKGGMSLKSVQEFEDEAAKTELKTILEAEGIDVEEKNLNVFLPDETKMNKDTTGMSEFVRDLYESAGVIEPVGDDATSMQPNEADPLAGSTFAADACQCAEIAGDGEWKLSLIHI